MGSSTYVIHEDIKVTNDKGLRLFVNTFVKYFPNVREIIESMIQDENEISFDSWDEIKFLSYWYDWEIVFLDGVASYIEGEIEFENDEEEIKARIEFKGGKSVVTYGEMKYRKFKPLLEEFNKHLKNQNFKMPKELKDLKILGAI